MGFYEELDAYYAAGEWSSTEEFMKTKLAEFAAEGDDGLKAYAVCASELACSYRNRSEFDKSLKVFADAMAAIEKSAGKGSADYAALLGNYAGTYRMMGESEKALELYKETLGIYEKLAAFEEDEAPKDAQMRYLVSGALNNIALTYRAIGELATATDYLSQAVSKLSDLPGYEDELATSMANLASMQLSAGDLDLSGKTLDEALAIFDSRPSPSPHRCGALNTKAMIAYASGRLDDAAELLEEARAGTEKVFGKNEDYSMVSRSLAMIYDELGEDAKAKAARLDAGAA